MKDILSILLYFSKFVTLDVRNKQVVKGSKSTSVDYSDFVTQIRALPEADSIPEIKNFFYSINEKFLADRIRSANGFLLFVEYGNIDFDKNQSVDKTEIVLAVSVVSEFSIANSDMIEEALLMQKALDILKLIIEKMYQDYENPDNCPGNEIIVYPVEVFPVIPAEFYDHGGWTAMFKRRH